MKTKNTILTALAITLCAASLHAQDRTYERHMPLLGGGTRVAHFKFTESNGELGLRMLTSGPRADPCFDGFVKLIKSFESGATLYTQTEVLNGCVPARFVFLNGDLSQGYLQGQEPGGGFMPVLDRVEQWKSKGLKPSLTLLK